MQHRIKKQTIELAVTQRDDIFALQQKASQYYYSSILPALEKIFDNLSDETNVLRIDRLEINLGEISMDKPVNEISMDDLYSILLKEIEGQVKRPNKQHYTSHSTVTQSNLTQLSPALHAGEQWMYYMQHGVLPWNASFIDLEWKTRVLEALATDFVLVSRLRAAIDQDRKVLVRIINEHQESFLVKLVEILTAQEQYSLGVAMQELSFLVNAGKGITTKPFEREEKDKPINIWIKVLKLAAVKSGKPTTLQLAQQVLRGFIQDQVITNGRLDSIKEEIHLLKPIVAEIVKSPADIRLAKIDDSPATNTSDIPALASSTDKLPEEGLFIQNAGLLLLHPFFRFLFKNNGLIVEGQFISREKQEKAIMLLHYLATGDNEAEEHLLAMPKILCSWPLDEPLELDAPLSESEKTEANDLLHAAIAQWTILKNTSVEGLREGFLQRNGKIMVNNENIHIQVEKSAIDVLLDHLPWNLSHIKLPWMKEMMRVEWR